MNNEKIIDELLKELSEKYGHQVQFEEAENMYRAGEIALTDEQEDALADEMAKIELMKKNFKMFMF